MVAQWVKYTSGARAVFWHRQQGILSLIQPEGGVGDEEVHPDLAAFEKAVHDASLSDRPMWEHLYGTDERHGTAPLPDDS